MVRPKTNSSSTRKRSPNQEAGRGRYPFFASRSPQRPQAVCGFLPSCLRFFDVLPAVFCRLRRRRFDVLPAVFLPSAPAAFCRFTCGFLPASLWLFFVFSCGFLPSGSVLKLAVFRANRRCRRELVDNGAYSADPQLWSGAPDCCPFMEFPCYVELPPRLSCG
jgi:hypothetical protein